MAAWVWDDTFPKTHLLLPLLLVCLCVWAPSSQRTPREPRGRTGKEAASAASRARRRHWKTDLLQQHWGVSPRRSPGLTAMLPNLWQGVQNRHNLQKGKWMYFSFSKFKNTLKAKNWDAAITTPINNETEQTKLQWGQRKSLHNMPECKSKQTKSICQPVGQYGWLMSTF